MTIIFLWSIGLLFTLGIAASDGGMEKSGVKDAIIILLAWPFCLGVVVGEYLSAIKSKEAQA